MNKIVCGKFDNNVCFNKTENLTNPKKIRIGSTNPSELKTKKYTPISINHEFILFNNKIYEHRDFTVKINQLKIENLIVLTNKEYLFFVDTICDFDIKIKIFENIFPIFKHIRYSSDLQNNYNELCKLLNQIELLNIRGNSLSHFLSTKYLYKIERKLRFKNTLDKYFAFAYKAGYQEVFKFKEENDDRCVISMDFNSMYLSNMEGKFIEPKSIKYIKFDYVKQDVEELNNGLYHVILHNPKNSFFNSFHPFKYTKKLKSFSFNLEQNQSIEILLFKNELLYYKQFFEKYEIIEGLYSKNNIKHPLCNLGMYLYSERLKYKNENNRLMQDYIKFQIINLHSSTNKKFFKQKWFKNQNELLSYLEKEYMIRTETLIDFPHHEYFKFQKCKNKINAKIINFNRYESVYSLSSQVVANSRLKMIQTIEQFLKFKSVEICYCNIDSIHISIDRSQVKSFLKYFENLFSDKIGKLKIETIANKGYWFDVGRYWLINDDNNLMQYKNILFNRLYSSEPFVFNRKFIYIRNNLFYKYKTIKYFNIFNSFSYGKKLNKNNTFIRYNYEEIKNFYVVNSSKTIEILHSKKIKSDVLKKLHTTVKVKPSVSQALRLV